MKPPERPGRGGGMRGSSMSLGGLADGPLGALLAPALAIVGLLLVGSVTLTLLNAAAPFAGGGGKGPGPGPITGGPGRTPAPSDVIVVEPEVSFPGSIVYAKAGNVWAQTGKDVRQVTSSGRDSMPSWSPDGQWIYFIRSTRDTGSWVVLGVKRDFELDYPDLMRVRSDGTGEPERIARGRFRSSGNTWFYWMRQPVLSPDGSTIALITEAPNPEQSNMVVQFLDPATGKYARANAPEIGVLGHQDPTWRPDGRYLLFVRNGRDGSRGAPRIMRYDTETKKSGFITGPGYLGPTYSPDGRYIAATKTSTRGTDIVILDASRGTELARITNDGRSWAPVWSPAGDAIAFLKIDGIIVDLRMAVLEGTAPSWSVKEMIDLTSVSGLDADSHPGWFVPASELPATPAPTVVPVASSAPPS